MQTYPPHQSLESLLDVDSFTFGLISVDPRPDSSSSPIPGLYVLIALRHDSTAATTSVVSLPDHKMPLVIVNITLKN
jgi:hypothetical protein